MSRRNATGPMVLVVAGALLLGCSSGASEPSTSGSFGPWTPDSEERPESEGRRDVGSRDPSAQLDDVEMMALLSRYYEALGDGDLETVCSFFIKEVSIDGITWWQSDERCEDAFLDLLSSQVSGQFFAEPVSWQEVYEGGVEVVELPRPNTALVSIEMLEDVDYPYYVQWIDFARVGDQWIIEDISWCDGPRSGGGPLC